MIRTFILPSIKEKVELPLSENLLKSFKDETADIICVSSIQQINMAMKSQWYMVLYENEWLPEDLFKIIIYFTEHTTSDSLVLYKKTTSNEFTKSPRVFRNWVQLRHDKLMPICSLLKYEHLLDKFMLGK